MKQITVRKLPACDFCKKEESAVYDAPTTTGAWANMCPPCYEQNKGSLLLGSERVVKATVEKSDNPDKVVIGIEDNSLSYIEGVIMGDELRSVTCPECGTDRQLEPDADGTYECECGVKVRMEDIMCKLM